jgi:hypothetical protein
MVLKKNIFSYLRRNQSISRTKSESQLLFRVIVEVLKDLPLKQKPFQRLTKESE